MADPRNEKRVVLVAIAPEAILHQFRANIPDFSYRLTIDGLPEDAAVTCVWYDHARQSFVFLVDHLSFAPVGPGDEPPLLSGHYELVRISGGSAVDQPCPKCGRSLATHLTATEALVEDRKRPKAPDRPPLDVCTTCGLSELKREA